VLALLTTLLCPAAGGDAGDAEPVRNKADDGWVSLFDGETLDGWQVKCRPGDQDKAYWTVEDGAITADVPEGSSHDYIWLVTDEEYRDFEISMKVQSFAGRPGNSGNQVRSRYDDETGWLDGPQLDIHPPGPWRNGFIYDETREVKNWIYPIVGPPSMARPEHAVKGWTWTHGDEAGAWNDVHIVCRGTRIQATINGVTVTDYEGAGHLDDPVHRARNVGLNGHVALQIHPGGQVRIRFKEVRLRSL
jgi:hypothetical protein